MSQQGTPSQFISYIDANGVVWTVSSDKPLPISSVLPSGAATAALQSRSSATSTTITGVTVGVGSTLVLAADANRLGAVFVNDSDEAIYLARGAAAVLNSGIRLNANGGAYEIGLDNLFTGAVNAICASGGKILCVDAVEA